MIGFFYEMRFLSMWKRIFSCIILYYILRSFREARVLQVIGLATQGLTGEYNGFMLGYNEET